MEGSGKSGRRNLDAPECSTALAARCPARRHPAGSDRAGWPGRAHDREPIDGVPRAQPIKGITAWTPRCCWRSETPILELGHAEEDRRKGSGDKAGRLALSLRSLARLSRVATRAAPVGHHGQRPGGGGTAGRTLRKTTNARKPPLAHQGHVHTQGGGGNAGRLARSLPLTRSLAPRCHLRRLRGRLHGHGGRDGRRTRSPTRTPRTKITYDT